VKETRRIATTGGEGLAQNPFSALDGAGLPAGSGGTAIGGSAGGSGRSKAPAGANLSSSAPSAGGTRGRVDILRETGGRAGKTVTVAANFTGIGLPEKETLAKRMRAACGCGGTVKDGRIEIQGDQRETVARILSEAGFRPVFAGG